MRFKLLFLVFFLFCLVPFVYGSGCIVSSILLSNTSDIGEYTAVSWLVRGTAAGHGVVNARCHVDVFNNWSRPVMRFPEVGDVRTGEWGFGVAGDDFGSIFYGFNYSVTLNVSCFCPVVNDLAGDWCIDSDNGSVVGGLSCGSGVVKGFGGVTRWVGDNKTFLLGVFMLIPCIFALSFALAGGLIDPKYWLLRLFFVFFQFIFFFTAGYFGVVSLRPGGAYEEVLDALGVGTSWSVYVLIALLVILVLVIVVGYFRRLKAWRKLRLEQ